MTFQKILSSNYFAKGVELPPSAIITTVIKNTSLDGMSRR